MNKIVSIMLAVAFIFGTLATTFVTTDLKDDLVKQLTKKELEVYKDIGIERRNIYFMGLGLGVLLSVIYILLLNKTKCDMVFKITTGISITMIVNYFFYILYPKSQYMIQHLDKKRENKGLVKDI